VFGSLLPVGFHPTDLPGLRRLCVDYFPGSSQRPRLMEAAELIVSLINRSSIPARLWIDGSFLTEDPEPDHFCLTMVLVESVFRSLSAEQHDFFEWFRAASLFEEHGCENYGIVIDAEREDYEILQEYWMRQYRFDRGRQSRGVAEFVVPSLAVP